MQLYDIPSSISYEFKSQTNLKQINKRGNVSGIFCCFTCQIVFDYCLLIKGEVLYLLKFISTAKIFNLNSIPQSNITKVVHKKLSMHCFIPASFSYFLRLTLVYSNYGFIPIYWIFLLSIHCNKMHY